MNLQVILRLDECVVRFREKANGGSSPVAVIRSHVHDVAGRKTCLLDGLEKTGEPVLGSIGEAAQPEAEFLQSGLKDSFHLESVVIGPTNEGSAKIWVSSRGSQL